MNRVIVAGATALMLSMAVVACGGGGGGSAPSSVAPGSGAGGGGSSGGAPASTATGGPATLSLLIPSANAAASATKRRPAYVASNTASVAVFAYPSSATPPPTATTLVNVGPGLPGCTSVSGGTSCTITVPAIYGSMTFTVKTYDGTLGSGNVLSAATFTQTITPNQAAIPATLSGVIAATEISVPQFSYPAGGGTFTATVNALDANGNVIVGGGTYNQPIYIGMSDPSVTASPSSVTGPGQPVTITYGASAPSGVTIRAQSAGLSANKVGAVDVSFGQPATSSAEAYVFDENQNAIFAFNAGANGAPGPQSRSYLSPSLISGYPLQMSASGNRIALTDTGSYTPSVAIENGGSASALTPTANFQSLLGLAYDKSTASPVSGDLAVIGYDPTYAVLIAYYAPGATGNAAPTRTIAGPVFSGVTSIAGLGIDASGNLYFATNNYPSPTFSVTKIAAGSSGSNVMAAQSNTVPFASGYLTGFAVAPDGTSAVATYNYATNAQIVQIFSPSLVNTATLSGGAIGNSYGAAMAFGPDDTLYFAVGSVVYAYSAGTQGTGAPARAFNGILAGPLAISGIAIGAPLTEATPAAGQVSGDMLSLAANRTWNYSGVSPATGQHLTVSLYVDPQPIDGNTGLVAFVLPTSAPNALPANGGVAAGSIGVSDDPAGGYDAQTYGSVSNNSFGLLPGAPLLVPSTLTLGQTFVPYAGVTATVRTIGSVNGIGACTNSPAAGADVIYVLPGVSEDIAYVPGCGITHLVTDSGTIFTLQSIESHPEVGQQSIARRTLQATYADTLRSLWQAVLVKH
jgi:hypothetical protein